MLIRSVALLPWFAATACCEPALRSSEIVARVDVEEWIAVWTAFQREIRPGGLEPMFEVAQAAGAVCESMFELRATGNRPER
jgi:hypothetical protein